MKNTIQTTFNSFVKENNLKIAISFSMPKGYETAFGTYDVTKQTLFLNESLFDKKERLFFTLFHELCHAKQYAHPECFKEEISLSLPYVVLYDGTVFKLEKDQWKTGKLDLENAIEIYNNLPYELSANSFAFEECKKIKALDQQEIKAIYEKTLPKEKIEFEELKKIFKQIDNLK